MKINNKSPKLTFTRCSNKALVFLFTTLAMSTDSLAEIIQIEFTQFDTYSIEVAHIGVGDTVEWLPTNKGHNVEFLAGPDMSAMPAKSIMDEPHSILFEQSGVYLYGCTPHANIGMLGLIVVGKDFHNLENINGVELSKVGQSVLRKLIQKAKSG